MEIYWSRGTIYTVTCVPEGTTAREAEERLAETVEIDGNWKLAEHPDNGERCPAKDNHIHYYFEE